MASIKKQIQPGSVVFDTAISQMHAIQALEVEPMDWHQEPPPSVGKTGVPRRKRKVYSDSSDQTIQNIFDLPTPFQQNNADAFLLQHPHLLARVPYPFAAPKVGVGIEVEVENVLKVDPNLQLCFWSMKPDGSLRNMGQEFVTPGVISVSLVEPALRQLFNGLNTNIDFSSRTSIHVHMDIHQLTMDQVLGLLLTYTAVENLLFKFVGNNRRTNIFCVPITETGLFDHLAGGTPKKVLWAIDSYWAKYTAFNLLPIGTQGSIEFRHMPGTAVVENILRWIDLITRLKLYVYKYDLKSIVAQISELNSTSYYKQFVEGVFGDLTAYMDMTHLLTDMERPVYLVKNSALANPFNEWVHSQAAMTSHLGQRLTTWSSGLNVAQLNALQVLASNHGMTDAEELWRELKANPHNYLKAWPADLTLIQTILKKPLPSVDELTQEAINISVNAKAINADYETLLKQMSSKYIGNGGSI